MSLMTALRNPSHFGGASPVEMEMVKMPIALREIFIGLAGPQEPQYLNKQQAVAVATKRTSLGPRTQNVLGAWPASVVKMMREIVAPTLESVAILAKINAEAAVLQLNNKPLVEGN